jgi:hypothetical protein
MVVAVSLEQIELVEGRRIGEMQRWRNGKMERWRDGGSEAGSYIERIEKT